MYRCRCPRVQPHCYMNHQPQALCFQDCQEEYWGDRWLCQDDRDNFSHWNFEHVRIHPIEIFGLPEAFVCTTGWETKHDSFIPRWKLICPTSSFIEFIWQITKTFQCAADNFTDLLISLTFYFMNNKNTCVFSVSPPNKNISPFSFAEHEWYASVCGPIVKSKSSFSPP